MCSSALTMRGIIQKEKNLRNHTKILNFDKSSMYFRPRIFIQNFFSLKKSKRVAYRGD